MFTEVKFYNHRYGNEYDHYFRTDYANFISTLAATTPVITANVNLGVTDGIKIINKFTGDFSKVNCAILNNDFYRIVSKEYQGSNVWLIGMVLDIVSARWDKIISSEILIKRFGLDRTVFNPLLMIQEKFTFNKIKTNQIDLSENTNKSWGYMIYIASGSLSTSKTITVDNGANLDFDIALTTPITQYQYFNAVNKIGNILTWSITIDYFSQIDGHRYIRYYRNNDNTFGYEDLTGSQDTPNPAVKITVVRNDDIHLKNHVTICHLLNLVYTREDYDGHNIINYPSSLGGLTVKCSYTDGTNNVVKYYENTIVNIGDTNVTNVVVDAPTADDYATIFDKSLQDILVYLNTTLSDMHYSNYALNQIYIPTGDYTVTLGVHNRCNDQPYICLFIPFIKNGTVDNTPMSQYDIENFLYALSIAGSGDNAWVYDIQVVPYCPISGVITYNNTNINTGTITVNKDIATTSSSKFVIIECKYTQFSLNINCPIEVSDYKLDAQKEYQLTSASGNQATALSVVMNGGIDYFTVSCSYRPYASTIRIQPNYKLMYGANYNDTRGLIIKEDTSITIISDAWITYTRQNINYLQSFNSGQDYEKAVLNTNQKADWGNYGFDVAERMTGTAVTAAGATAIAGPIAGVATLAAGVASEGVQAAQMAFNQSVDRDLLNERLEQQRAQFNYTLGNIKALPQNLGKVTGLTSIFNYVPYIQVFEPTQVEMNLYKDYLDDNGCAVGTEMIPQNYAGSFDYLEGIIVRSTSAWDIVEYRSVCDLLNQGVRLYKE